MTISDIMANLVNMTKGNVMLDSVKNNFNEYIGWELFYRGYNSAVATLVLIDFLSNPTIERGFEYLPDAALHAFEATFANSDEELVHQCGLLFNAARALQAGYHCFNSDLSEIPFGANLADIPNHTLNMYHRFTKLNQTKTDKHESSLENSESGPKNHLKSK